MLEPSCFKKRQKSPNQEPGLGNRGHLKVLNQETGLGNRGRLKVLNDTNLNLND